MIHNEDTKIAIVGLGYVGLPLAVEFGKLFTTTGFDINKSRVKELLKGIDITREVEAGQITGSVGLSFTSDFSEIAHCNIFVVTVPTPIDKYKKPDLNPLEKASEAIGSILKKGDVVIYESTVYPGATEEICVPILEEKSGLSFNKDFYCGYSPERINPGDKEHKITNIQKVTSGSTPKIATEIDELYKEIIVAGTFKVNSIKIAEAAKVIENTQRDLNIALVNELAMIFNKLDIDTTEVLNAASTKWNFIPFQPGLVGGHCIGVDPYYLTYKAQSIGFNPEIVLAGRRTNDGMSKYVSSRLIKEMIKKQIPIFKSKILILGLTFKENCPDIRNTKIIDIFTELQDYGCLVDINDPYADKADVIMEYGISLTSLDTKIKYDAIILAVAHDEYVNNFDKDYKSKLNNSGIIFDLKNVIPASHSDIKL